MMLHATLCLIRTCDFRPESSPRQRAPHLSSGLHSHPEENQRLQTGVPAWTHKQRVLYFSVQKWIAYRLGTGHLYGV